MPSEIFEFTLNQSKEHSQAILRGLKTNGGISGTHLASLFIFNFQ